MDLVAGSRYTRHMLESALFEKYDRPVPRYTSYPTVPSWSRTPTDQEWFEDLRQTLKPTESRWGLYIHIPFCETLCTYCGCNTIITRDHKNERPYLELLLREIEIYLREVPEFAQNPVSQIHFGGGSPTFLSPESMNWFLKELFERVPPRSDFDGSIEVDPRRLKREQLAVMREMGFSRVSLGVQDFNPLVQKLINRFQTPEETAAAHRMSKELGFRSVNFDLVYGLPAQNMEGIRNTIAQTIELKPDRIALYSFALVPWIKPGQRIFKDSDLPSAPEKRALYEYAREELLKAGYLEVGMDHFALPEDSLAVASKAKTLHRNFMGYTDIKTDVLLGIGVSSISESRRVFHQNEKTLPKYQESIQAGHLATLRGHVLSERDLEQRRKILRMMTTYSVGNLTPEEIAGLKNRLAEPVEDGLARIDQDKILLTEKGRPFLRNVCAAFDDYYKEEAKRFSRL